MFVVEVEVMKQWTDRGDNSWVTIRVIGGKDEGKEQDVEPSRLIQVKRSMILVHDDSIPVIRNLQDDGKGGEQPPAP